MPSRLFDWLHHICPNCGAKSRKRILGRRLKSSDRVDGSRTRWSRGGHVPVEEPYTVWLYSYEIEHLCRSCGHRWTEHVTKQRP